jgi:hypothetical protein
MAGFASVLIAGIVCALINVVISNMGNVPGLMQVALRYFAVIKPGRLVLWCYLIWYFVTVYYHFDASPKLWINSAGISVVIGTALMLSVSRGSKPDHWQTFRLYWMPFAVSSFAALIKNQGYVVIFSPHLREVVTALVACGLFLAMVAVIKWSYRSREVFNGS